MLEAGLSMTSKINLDLYRPSVYTTALLNAIDENCANIKMNAVLDMGAGSGICLAALGRLGASRMWGVDISKDSIEFANTMLGAEFEQERFHLIQGDMFEKLDPKMTFDVIVANLPQVPGNVDDKDRPSEWGGGGRRLLDQLIKQLPRLMARDGMALIAHYDPNDFQQTEKLIQSLNLRCETVCGWYVYESLERFSKMPDPILKKHAKSIMFYGPYAIVRARIIKITF